MSIYMTEKLFNFVKILKKKTSAYLQTEKFMNTNKSRFDCEFFQFQIFLFGS